MLALAWAWYSRSGGWPGRARPLDEKQGGGLAWPAVLLKQLQESWELAC
jgi:hypothetical protein